MYHVSYNVYSVIEMNGGISKELTLSFRKIQTKTGYLKLCKMYFGVYHITSIVSQIFIKQTFRENQRSNKKENMLYCMLCFISFLFSCFCVDDFR